MKLLPQPTRHYDEESGKMVEGYLPDFLEKNRIYRVVAKKENRWGTLVKTDRLNKWINLGWFREI